MEKIISVPLSFLHYFFAILILCVFHPIQWICKYLIGKDSQYWVVVYENWLLLQVLKITANGVKFHMEEDIPKGVPVVFVPNHQSLNEIVPLIWFLRDYRPRFVAKKELDVPIPSIQIYLRGSGSVFIDRQDPEQATQRLRDFGKYLNDNNFCGLIFPEGTRSRDGKLKKFKTKGLKTIMQEMPNGFLVPVTINNSWKVLKFGNFPLGLNSDFNITTHKPIPISSGEADRLIEMAREAILSNHKEGEREDK